MCKEVNIINLCSRFNPSRLDYRCIHRNSVLRMMWFLVGLRVCNIGICRHRNVHKYIPSIRLNLRYPYYFVISWLSSPYDETTPNLIFSPEIEAKCLLAHSILESSTPRKLADLTSKSVLPLVSATK